MATILLVEDDANECLLYEAELRGEGFDVVVARTAQARDIAWQGDRVDVEAAAGELLDA